MIIQKMFGFWKKKVKKETYVSAGRNLLNLSTDSLTGIIRSTFESQNEVVAALFLVAYENFPVYYSLLKQNGAGSSLEEIATFLDSLRKEKSNDSFESEYASRRLFYFYLVALLKILHARAENQQEAWDAIAPIWVKLLIGARALRSVINNTSLWTPSEVVYFEEINTEDEGEYYCLALMAPSEIRYHPLVKEWQERNLTPEVKAELRAIDRLFDDR